MVVIKNTLPSIFHKKHQIDSNLVKISVFVFLWRFFIHATKALRLKVFTKFMDNSG